MNSECRRCMYISLFTHPSITFSLFFFFNDTATTEIYTLSIHDALPISPINRPGPPRWPLESGASPIREASRDRSEEHTSELQSQSNLVCRLLLEKKNKPPSARSLSLVRNRCLTPVVVHMISSPMTAAAA